MRQAQLFLFLSFFIVLLGCTQKNEAGGSRLTRTNGTASGSNNINDSANCSSCGRIFGDSQTAFQSAWYEFFGAGSDDLGTISARIGDSTGVTFNGSLVTNSTISCSSGGVSQLDFTRTHLTLTVYDSYAVSGEADKIQVTFSDAVEGQINGSNFYVVFEDSEGTLEFTGQIANGTAQGFVNFSMYDSNDNLINGPQNVLRFSIPVNAFLSCR